MNYTKEDIIDTLTGSIERATKTRIGWMESRFHEVDGEDLADRLKALIVILQDENNTLVLEKSNTETKEEQ